LQVVTWWRPGRLRLRGGDSLQLRPQAVQGFGVLIARVIARERVAELEGQVKFDHLAHEIISLVGYLFGRGNDVPVP
jgi:hypothetical protein